MTPWLVLPCCSRLMNYFCITEGCPMCIIPRAFTWRGLLLLLENINIPQCAADRPSTHRSWASPAAGQAGWERCPAPSSSSIHADSGGEGGSDGPNNTHLFPLVLLSDTALFFPYLHLFCSRSRHTFFTGNTFRLFSVYHLSTFLSVWLPSLPPQPLLLTGAGLGVINYWDGFMWSLNCWRCNFMFQTFPEGLC